MPSPIISYLTNIHFGHGARHGLAEVLRQFGVSRPLLVTDPGIRNAGILDQISHPFEVVFDRVDANPSAGNVSEGAKSFRAGDCDGVVAVGGGSPIDCAKAIALSTTHEGPLEQYALIRGGLSKITKNKPPVIAVPTTSGTGSEVGRAALITFDATTKLAIVGPAIIPDAAICDPELTVGMPPELTAATGMDAVSHCVETYCSPKFNPVADAIALDGLQRAWKWLPLAVSQGANLEARSEMMMASLQGALAFQKGLGMIHSLSHPLGAIASRPHHGTLNSIFLPHVLRFNQPECPEKMVAMQRVTAGESVDLAEAFERLTSSFEIPQRLSEIGISRNDLEPLAAPALADHSSASNPRPLTLDDCRGVYQAAL